MHQVQLSTLLARKNLNLEGSAGTQAHAPVFAQHVGPGRWRLTGASLPEAGLTLTEQSVMLDTSGCFDAVLEDGHVWSFQARALQPIAA